MAEAIVRRVVAYVRGFYPPSPPSHSAQQNTPYDVLQHVASMIEAQSFALIQSAAALPPSSPVADGRRPSEAVKAFAALCITLCGELGEVQSWPKDVHDAAEHVGSALSAFAESTLPPSSPAQPQPPRLTDLQRICNLNVVQAMAVQQYIERWAALPPSSPVADPLENIPEFIEPRFWIERGMHGWGVFYRHAGRKLAVGCVQNVDETVARNVAQALNDVLYEEVTAALQPPSSPVAAAAPATQPAILGLYQCKTCCTRWLLWPASVHGGGWNLLDKHSYPGACCDNAAMGEQIEHLRDIPLTAPGPNDRLIPESLWRALKYWEAKKLALDAVRPDFTADQLRELNAAEGRVLAAIYDVAAAAAPDDRLPDRLSP